MIKADDAVNDIKRKIVDDPTIKGAKHILVFASKKGFGPFKKEEVHLGGFVYTELDKKKAEEYAQQSAPGLTLVNEIEVQPE